MGVNKNWGAGQIVSMVCIASMGIARQLHVCATKGMVIHRSGILLLHTHILIRCSDAVPGSV